MEKETLDKILNKLLNDIISLYREELTTGNINSSGTLYNALRSQINENEGSLILQDYWKYVESGRQPGRFPNINSIKDWIKQKPIIPNTYNGKLPSTDQLTFLIARKIANKGIVGKEILQKALDRLDTTIINTETTKDINNQLNIVLNEIIH